MTKREIENLKVGSRRYESIAIVIGFLGFILGIITGATYDDVAVMIYVWLSTAFTVTIFSFMFSVCHRLDLLIEKK